LDNYVAYLVGKVAERDPRHAKKLQRFAAQQDDLFYERANDFYRRYESVLHSEGKTLEYGIDCYLRMCDDIVYETVQFMQTGRYTSASFDDVRRRVYDNPDVMSYQIHGILVSQFLWRHHYAVYDFFCASFPKHAPRVKRFLEIGAGHGAYVNEALIHLPAAATLDVVDISETSIDLAKHFVGNDRVNYRLANVFDFKPDAQYDFITMGEVLEHVEDPIALLQRVNGLLNDNGVLFLTTPANAPNMDHIFLFNDTAHIVGTLGSGGFQPLKQLEAFAEDVELDKARKQKVAMMYAAFLKKS
jgi:2-polyprenyl-3-methyl-5-hydroxy-6-metoxy-1,4-benzoquinol methylase